MPTTPPTLDELKTTFINARIAYDATKIAFFSADTIFSNAENSILNYMERNNQNYIIIDSVNYRKVGLHLSKTL